MILLRLIIALAVVLGIAAAQVGPKVTTDHAETRLVAEHSAVVPGTTTTVAVVQELEHHWHVYWQNPGDSGLPLDLRWTLPGGFEVSDPAYPLPHRLSLGPLVNFGHEGEPVFLLDLTVPEGAVPGTVETLSVEATWLICADICVPESATLRLPLPIGEAEGPLTPFAEQIAAARAEQPVPAPFATSYFDAEGGPVLVIEDAPAGTLEFYPFGPSLIAPSADVREVREGATTYLGFEADFAYRTAQPTRLAGVLIAVDGSARTGYQIFAERAEPPAVMPNWDGADAGPVEPVSSGLLIASIGLAFLGGLLLNVMPCVFPIVFLKAAGFAAVAREERATVRLHGLLYTAGILVTFLGLAGLLMVLRAQGEALGWGFHLQSPPAVAGFALLIFLIGLNLAGLFEIGTSVQGTGSGLASKGGKTGAFFTGLLAVAVAAPCIGPFLGGAMGLALGQPGWTGLLIFAAIGLGLAAPYLILSFVPAFAQLLPRPGAWMETLKQLFSFAMFATVVWLVWVVSTQTGPSGILRLGLGMVMVAFAAWLFGRSQRGQGGMVSRLVALIALIGGVAYAVTEAPASTVEEVAYDPALLAELREAGTPVFIDFTASWCVTCQLNKITVLTKPEVTEAFAERGIVFMVADWTRRDSQITQALEEQGRAGVPLYLYYGGGAPEPVVLPQILTVNGVLSATTE